jgi:hypothetical protein
MTFTPVKWRRGSTATTSPEMGEWTGALTNASASPSFCPAATLSPLATMLLQGAPVCWWRWTTTSAGAAIVSIGFPALASFLSGG